MFRIRSQFNQKVQFFIIKELYMQKLSLKYTILPLNQEQENILQKWINSKDFPSKSSLCRFYLRGLCIMKKQFCRFAHGIDDIVDSVQIDMNQLTEKQKRKIDNNYKVYFSQKPLFFIAPTNYENLYEFQFEKQFQQKQLPTRSVHEINKMFNERNQIRTYFHEWIWEKFIKYLQKKYPNTIMINSWVEKQYIKIGFLKPHTHCKYHNFLTFIANSNRYARHDLIIPPLMQAKTSVIFDTESTQQIWILATKQYRNFKKTQQQIIKQSQKKKQSRIQIITKYLSNKLLGQKSTICKFYMKGVCIFTQQECKYCHTISTLNYQKREFIITDEKWFYQPALYFQKNKNYVAIWRYQNKIKYTQPNFEIRTLDEINTMTSLRQQIRKKMHMQLYRDFMELLEQNYPQANFTIDFLNRQYTNAGFNKTEFNKFPHFIQEIKQIKYYEDIILMPPLLTKKTKFIFKIPELDILDEFFENKFIIYIHNLVKQRNLEELIVINQADLRKKFYQLQDPFSIPIHEYLKLKKITFKEFMIKNLYNNIGLKQFQNIVKFDLANNAEKLKQKIKEYFQIQKKYIHALSHIQNKLKLECEAQINNYFTNSNFRLFMAEQIIELGKKIYMWPLNNQCRIIDKKQKNKYQIQKYCSCKIQSKSILFNQVYDQNLEIIQIYSKERIVVVNNEKSLHYATLVLNEVKEVSVDLQGKLARTGYIYLVQFGIKNKYNNLKNQILIFDIFGMQKVTQNSQLLQRCKQLLQNILSSKDIIKIMHDCKQDSIALHHILKICLKNVFDLCGMHIYYSQKLLYQNIKQKSEIFRKIYDASNRVPGLNTILETYKSPNGINSLKDKMRLNFQSSIQQKILYFQSRPINPEFLEYAARDVEDLIDIYHVMKELDDENLHSMIGILYSNFGVNEQQKNNSANSVDNNDE